MKEKHCYIIGKGEISDLPGNPTGVWFIPEGKNGQVEVWEYAESGPGSSGAAYSYLQCMKNLAEKPKFHRLFRDANAEWFIPFIERMAAGEKVPIEEIEARHLELFDRPLEFTLYSSD